MTRRPRPHAMARRGFTIVEAMIATLIVAVAMAACLSGTARSVGFRTRVADRVRAEQLALDLVAEVLQTSYLPPTTPDPTGPTRSGWTCVDDYSGLTEAAPATKSGNAIPDTTGLSRSVTLQFVNPANMQPGAATDTGIKVITVTVRRGTLVLATISAYRTLGWVDGVPTPDDATGNHAPLAVAAVAGGKGLIGHGAPFSTAFDGSSSSDADGDTLTYVWDFGDGTQGAGVTVAHTFNTVGNYTVTLTIDDGRGGVGISVLSVAVNAH